MPVHAAGDVPQGVIQAAVLTVSDRCAAGEAEDGSGPAVEQLLAERLGARVSWRRIVPDDAETIAAAPTTPKR